MKSAIRLLTAGLLILATAILAGPVVAQSLPAGSGDPFSGVPSVASDQMSDVKGNVPGAAGARTLAGAGDSECGAAPCGGAVGTGVGSTASSVSASGNVVTVNVTAINIQTSVIGTGVLNSGGGLNSAGAN